MSHMHMNESCLTCMYVQTRIHMDICTYKTHVPVWSSEFCAQQVGTASPNPQNKKKQKTQQYIHKTQITTKHPQNTHHKTHTTKHHKFNRYCKPNPKMCLLGAYTQADTKSWKNRVTLFIIMPPHPLLRVLGARGLCGDAMMVCAACFICRCDMPHLLA